MSKQMEKFAWRAKIKEGTEEEYKKRHDEIWPEMTAVLNEAGIHNYSIWLSKNDLFGYYECADIDHATRVQSNSPVVQKWNEYMADILMMDFDPETGVTPLLKLMFIHD
jgi:L-rhamnose mutarotase